MQTKNWQSTLVQFILAQSISLLGSSIVQYAIIWYITLTTSSGSMITISTICGFAPQIIISLFGGAILDRYDRKKIIMISDSLIAISTLILTILFFNGYRNIELLYLVLIIRSAGSGIQTPAVLSLIPQITPSEHLMRVNGIYSTISSLTMFLSPALSGLILSLFPLEATLLIDVITAIIGISITHLINIPPLINKATSSAIAEIKSGFSYLREKPFIRNLLIFQIIILFLISPSAFLTPLMVTRSFGPEVWRLSISEMTYSIGSIIGGIIISSNIGFKNRLHTTILASAIYGLCMLGLGLAPIFMLFLLINLIIGVTSPCYSTPINVLIQERVESHMHGKIFSFMQIASSCALPLGMLLFGPLADLIKIQYLLLFNGTLVILITSLFYLNNQSPTYKKA